MLHVIKRNQFIKSDIDTVWDFISSPANLALITPAFMKFEIIGDIAEVRKKCIPDRSSNTLSGL